MSFEVFIWVIQILAILFCVSGVICMGVLGAELVYRKKTRKIEYERAKSKEWKGR